MYHARCRKHTQAVSALMRLFCSVMETRSVTPEILMSYLHLGTTPLRRHKDAVQIGFACVKLVTD